MLKYYRHARLQCAEQAVDAGIRQNLWRLSYRTEHSETLFNGQGDLAGADGVAVELASAAQPKRIQNSVQAYKLLALAKAPCAQQRLLLQIRISDAL